MFPMTITICNPAQLNAVLSAMGIGDLGVANDEPASAPATAAASKATKKTIEKADTAAKYAEQKAITTEPPVEAAPSPEQKPETLTQMSGAEAEKALQGHATRPAEAPTYQGTADAVTKLARAKGRDAAVAVLSKFGAAKLPEIKPADFRAVIAACEAAEA